MILATIDDYTSKTREFASSIQADFSTADIFEDVTKLQKAASSVV